MTYVDIAPATDRHPRGDIDAAAEWDAYVAEWRKAGGDDIIAELEQAPIVSEFREGRLTY